MKDLTLILPAHNEGASILETILEIDSSLPNKVKVIIYVSEDGSSDNTREQVKAATKLVKNASVELSNSSERLGYSRGVIRGIQNCTTELIGFMDADGQCDPKDLNELISQVKFGRIAIGYRNPRNDSKYRIIYSKAFGIMFRIFGGPRRKDPSSPFIVAQFSDIKNLSYISPKLSFGFWWEFQMRTKYLGLEVIEIPVNHRARSAGVTQVYSLRRIPRIVFTHLVGLWILRRELRSVEK
jgi:dolichol-phosphate mannosyltransferase